MDIVILNTSINSIKIFHEIFHIGYYPRNNDLFFNRYFLIDIRRNKYICGT